MTAEEQKISLACPSCQRRLRPADLYRVAATNVKRTCPKCKRFWSLTIHPIRVQTSGDELLCAVHRLEWTLVK